MYQPKIKEKHIRRLYFKAKREGRKMTHLVDEALEDYLYGEPEPSEEGRKDAKVKHQRFTARNESGSTEENREKSSCDQGTDTSGCISHHAGSTSSGEDIQTQRKGMELALKWLKTR
ncbi:MAG TPA: hypothetical protein VGX03_02590 [Candidatus Binatia bacterium]|jgi:hypothetical protein|nr:hypothetical protein [Candidatus Binatia bacterium]